MAVFRNGFGGNGSVHLNKPTASKANRHQTRIRAKTIVLILLFVTIAGSIYLLHLSYRVAMKNMTQNNTNGRLKPEIPTTPVKTQTNDGGINNSQKSSSSISISRQINDNKCAFRSYPSNRLYGLFSKSPPKFLSEAAYIRGQWPIILNPEDGDNKILENNGKNDDVVRQTSPVKVCIDTTSWENLIDENGKERLPFTDGHNPSVISLSPNPYSKSKSPDNTDNNNQHQQQHIRLDPKHLSPLANALFPAINTNTNTLPPLSSLFMGVTIFGGGQCKFGLTPEDVDNYRFSLYDEPQGGKRAVIAILAPPNTNPNDKSKGSSSSFQTLGQTTLLLERDVKYGKNRRAIQPEKTSSGGFARMHQEFDDPRLFFHLGRVWILYRNGPLFGYNDQIHNPIHFEEVVPSSTSSSSSGGEGNKGGSGGDGGAKFVAYVKASETVRVGGGRNIALISEEPIGANERGEVEWVSNPGLKALTWVDPVTVKDDIDLGDVEGKLLSNRRLLEVGNANYESVGEYGVAMASNSFRGGTSIGSFSEHGQSQQHRRLGSKPTKSNIHGTNGYMVPLQSTGELLGIAHFHRPENRKASDFALHGHHYTHAFFTIARQASGDSTKDIGSRPFKLKRLSNEFVFRANFLPAGEVQLPKDGDVIQFASGIDVVGSDVDGQLIISYGVNDCEGAVFTLAMEVVQRMLIGVDPGQEVVDLMENVQR